MNEEEQKSEVPEQQKIEENKTLFKYIKLRNGDKLVSMLEFSKDDDTVVTLYNPMKLVIMSDALSSLLGDKLGNGNMPTFVMEEWLPPQVVSEQVCEIFLDEIVTMCDLNDKFAKAYTGAVMKKVQMEEIMRRRDLQRSRAMESLQMSEEEEIETEQEDLQEVLEDKIKDFKKNLN